MNTLRQLWHTIRHSLSLRLFLLFMLAGVAISGAFQGFIGKALRDHLNHQVVPHLDHYADYIRRDIGYPPNIERAQALTQSLPLEMQITHQGKRWASTNDVPRFRYRGHRHPRPSWYQSQSSLDMHGFTLEKGFYRGLGVIRMQSQDKQTEILIWSQGFDERGNLSTDFIISLALILGILILLYWFIHRLFQPIQTIQQGVKAIGSGQLDQRIPVKRSDELGELGNSINEMADDIQQILNAKRELLLAISHELRSPLTRAKVSLALLEDSSSQQNIQRDIEEMEKLITELLESERLKGRHQVLNLQVANLNELVIATLNEHFPDAPIELELAEDTPNQQLDSTRIKLVIKNLLDNALKHQPENSDHLVELKTSITDSNIKLTVQDYGTGIDAEHLPHLTEAFYRVDPSRQRKTGGFGLGLHLVKLITEAHQGALSIESQQQQGTCLTISLPRRAHYTSNKGSENSG